MSKKVGLSSLLAHFEESLQRAGSADIAARLATLRERYQAGSTSYSTALSELEGMVGHEAVLDAAQLAAAHVKDAGADPTPPLSDSLQGGVLKREVGSTAEERAPEGATAGSLLGISTVHGGPSSSRQDAAAAPWAGHFSFDQQQNPAVGKAAVPLMPLVVEEGPSSSTQGGAEEAAGAPIPLSIRVDVAEPGPSSPSRRKRPREPAPAPVAVGRGGGAGLAAERPQRARKGTTRYDPDDVATVPQMGGRGRRAAESAPGDSSPLLNSRATPPPPSPRVAAASAVLMGAACAAHHQAEASMSGGWDRAASPSRMSPRLASRLGTGSVPACDALLLLGASVARGPPDWSLGNGGSRTPLSPRSVASRQSCPPPEPSALYLAAALAQKGGRLSPAGAPSSSGGARGGARGRGGDGGSAAENGASERSSEKRSAAKPAGSSQKRGRVVHSPAFKLRLVREALLRPPENRIKPTCRRYPSVEPCQLRKWINARANLEKQAREARAAAGDMGDDYE